MLLGDESDGFETLKRALEIRETAVLSLHGFVRLTPELFHLRQDPRFVSLMQALNLPLTAQFLPTGSVTKTAGMTPGAVRPPRRADRRSTQET